MFAIAVVAFAGFIAAGIPQDVYDAPPLSADVGAAFEEATRQPLALGEMPPPEPFRRLALAYSSGEGVEKDNPAACGYAQLAYASARHRSGGDDFRTAPAKALVAALCDPLTYYERIAALDTLTCPTAGIRRGTVIELEPGWWVVLNARHVVINHPSGESDLGVEAIPCGRVARIKHTVFRQGNSQARHLLEVFVWRSAMTEKGLQRSLVWRVFEVRTSTVKIMDTRYWSEAGTISPNPPGIPGELADGAPFRPGPHGEIFYDFPQSGELRRAGSESAVK